MAGHEEFKMPTNEAIVARVRDVLRGITAEHLKEVATTERDITAAQSEFIAQFLNPKTISYDGSTLTILLSSEEYTKIAAKMLFGKDWGGKGKTLQIKGSPAQLLASINQANPSPDLATAAPKEEKKATPPPSVPKKLKISDLPSYNFIKRLHDRIYYNFEEGVVNLGTLSPEFQRLSATSDRASLFSSKKNIQAIANEVDAIFKKFRITQYVQDPNKDIDPSKDTTTETNLMTCHATLGSLLSNYRGLKRGELTPNAALFVNHLADVFAGNISFEAVEQHQKILSKLSQLSEKIKSFAEDKADPTKKTSAEITQQLKILLDSAGIPVVDIKLLLPTPGIIASTKQTYDKIMGIINDYYTKAQKPPLSDKAKAMVTDLAEAKGHKHVAGKR